MPDENKEETRLVKRTGKAVDKFREDLQEEFQSQIGLAQAAREYVLALGLPAESTSAILQAYVTRREVAKKTHRQAGLPPSQRKLLVRTNRGGVLSDQALKQVDDFVIDNGIPYDTLAYGPQGPIPLTTARQLKLSVDPRGCREPIFEIVDSKLSGPDAYVVVRCSLSFWDGSSVTGEVGACSWDELMKSFRPGSGMIEPSIHIMLTRAHTRAFNRASSRAAPFIGASGAEDDLSEVSQGTVLQSVPIVVKPPRTMGDVISRAMQTYQLSLAEISDIVGYNFLTEGKTSERVWNDLEQAMVQRTQGAIEDPKKEQNEHGPSKS